MTNVNDVNNSALESKRGDLARARTEQSIELSLSSTRKQIRDYLEPDE